MFQPLNRIIPVLCSLIAFSCANPPIEEIKKDPIKLGKLLIDKLEKRDFRFIFSKLHDKNIIEYYKKKFSFKIDDIIKKEEQSQKPFYIEELKTALNSTPTKKTMPFLDGSQIEVLIFSYEKAGMTHEIVFGIKDGYYSVIGCNHHKDLSGPMTIGGR